MPEKIKIRRRLLGKATSGLAYPPLGFYDTPTNITTGTPLYSGGVLQDSVIQQWAKRHVVVIDAPWAMKSDLLARFRFYNPSIRLLAKFYDQYIYFNPATAFDPANDIRGKIANAVHAVSGDNGVLWSAYWKPSQYGSQDWFNPELTYTAPRPSVGHFSLWNMNWANAAATAAYAQVIIDNLVSPGLYDGIFTDFARAGIDSATGHGSAGGVGDNNNLPHPWEVFPYSPGYETATGGQLTGWNLDTIDLGRAYGVTQDSAGWALFYPAWKSGHTNFYHLIRAAAPDNFIICKNDGGLPDTAGYADANGSMVEAWPNQGGAHIGTPLDAYGKWNQNMLGGTRLGLVYPGIFALDAAYRKPVYNWLNMLPDNSSSGILVANNLRCERYKLATLCLCSAIGHIGNNDTPTSDTVWTQWWPEYSVNVATGQSTDGVDPRYRGWLGTALSDRLEVSTGVWIRDFVRGMVVVNTNTTQKVVNLGATFTRITSGIGGDTVNVGGNVTSVTIAANDAIFLIRPGAPGQ